MGEKRVVYSLVVDPHTAIEDEGAGHFREDQRVLDLARALEAEGDEELGRLMRSARCNSSHSTIDEGGPSIIFINVPYISEAGNDRQRDVIHWLSMIGREVCRGLVEENVSRGEVVGCVIALQRD